MHVLSFRARFNSITSAHWMPSAGGIHAISASGVMTHSTHSSPSAVSSEGGRSIPVRPSNVMISQVTT